jgi:hypothetical protein
MATLAAIDFSYVLLADARAMPILATSLCLVAALLVAALVIALVSRWRRRREVEDDLSPNAQLAQFRSLFEAGTITEEEFERLRNLLGGRLRDTMGVPPKEPPAPQQPSRQPPDNPETGIRPA